MAKVLKPIRFTEHFGIDGALLDTAGVLNPTLNVDTLLFIDPLLFEASRHEEISAGARSTYQEHFTKVIKLLRGSKETGDVAWRSAQKLLSFPEIKWTCLGYGAGSVSGSGSGDTMTKHLIRTAKQIVDLGVEDPDLFVAMALFESDEGGSGHCRGQGRDVAGRRGERTLTSGCRSPTSQGPGRPDPGSQSPRSGHRSPRPLRACPGGPPGPAAGREGRRGPGGLGVHSEDRLVTWAAFRMTSSGHGPRPGGE